MLKWLYKYKKIDINSIPERKELNRLREEKLLLLRKKNSKTYRNDMTPSLFEGNNLKQTANFNLNDSDEVNEGNEEEDEEEEEDKKTNYDKKYIKESEDRSKNDDVDKNQILSEPNCDNNTNNITNTSVNIPTENIIDTSINNTITLFPNEHNHNIDSSLFTHSYLLSSIDNSIIKQLNFINKTIVKGTTILSNAMYFIIQGSFSSSLNKKTYRQYETFGEIDLLLNHQSSYIANEDSEVYILEQNMFNATLKEVLNSRMTLYYSSLCKFPLLSYIDEIDLQRLSLTVKEVRYDKGDIIKEENDTTTNDIVLIDEGEVYAYYKDATIIYKEGDYFNELSIQFKAVAKTDSKLFLISKLTSQSLLKSIEDVMVNNSYTYTQI